MMIRILCLSLVLLLSPSTLWAQIEHDEVFLEDKALEQKAKDIFKSVRCVVCQSQAIDDSQAGLAKDFRQIIRTQVSQGKEKDEILGYLRNRYGDFVLLNPPIESYTLLLWVAPFAMLILVVIIVALWYRRMAQQLNTTKQVNQQEDS